MKEFFKKVLSSDDPTSSKRLVTLIISLHFIVASFVILFIAFYVIFYTTRGKVDTDLLGMLKDVLEYDFYIILSGLGFITADTLGKTLVERAKAKFGRFGNYGGYGGYGGYDSGWKNDPSETGLPPFKPVDDETDDK